MSLGTCRDCGLQVSTAAASCPRCGRVFAGGLQKAESIPVGSRRFVFIAILVGIGFLAFVRACSNSVASTAGELEASARERGDAQEIGEAEYAVQQTLRDPSSARFESVVVVRKPGSVAVCGAVNAKNGFGGYSGLARFMARNQVALVESPDNTRAFSKVWNRGCTP
jgi:hypothetical protein